MRSDFQTGVSRTIVITGASRGLGAALARAYAGPEVLLGLTARQSPLLVEAAEDCEQRGACVRHAHIDVEDALATRQFLHAIDAERPIDLVIVNAGRFSGNRAGGALEPLESALGQIRTNLAGAIITADAAVEIMRKRQQGRIAFVLSLAALYPLADAPAYSASKAGLAAYALALREMLRPHGIWVSLIYPGHIATDQTRRHVGKLPLIMTANRAAQTIKRALDQGRDNIYLPRRMHWLVRAGSLLPPRLSHLANRPFRFHVDDG